MTAFEQFIQELDRLPKVDASFAYVESSKLVNESTALDTFVITESGETREQLESKLMNGINKVIQGKKAWVRMMPVLREENGIWIGKARFAIEVE